MERDSISRTLRRFSNMRYLLVLEGIGVGAAAGLVTVLFRAVLSQGETVLHAALAFGTAHPYFIPLWFVILLGAAGLVTYLLKWEPLISGSGIPQVEGEMQGRIRTVWWRVLLAKFLGGLLTIGAGLALGREGPSIQLGAMAGKGVSRLTKRVRTEEKLLMTCGASAGLAAAFNAPLAGVLFSLEELHKNFSLDVLLPAMASSITADVISRYIFGLKPVFDFSGIAMMPLKNYWLVPVLGLILGLFGVLYNLCVDKAQNLYDKIKIPYIKTAIPFVLAGILGFVWPAVLGGGHGLIAGLTGQTALWGLLGLLAVRFAYSILSFSAGVPGGIFLPLLVLGAVAGSLVGGTAAAVGLDVHLENFVILGMAGYFAAVVRAPVTGILLICEMTGTLSHMICSAPSRYTISFCTGCCASAGRRRRKPPPGTRCWSTRRCTWARRPAANGSATYPGLQGASSFPSGGARRSWFLKGTPGCGRGTISPCCATNTTAKRYTARWRNSANPPSFPAALI